MSDQQKTVEPAEAEAIREISFGKAPVDPDAAKSYMARIEAAKKKGPTLKDLKGRTPVGGIERPPIPLLTNLPSGGPSGLTAEGGVAPRPPGSPVLSQETADQLQAMAKASAAAAGAEKTEEAKRTEEDKKEELLEMFDFSGQGEAERILNNKKRRQAIEARCEPMDFEDLLMKDEVVQAVPIIPDKFIAVFRSLRPEDSLFLKQYLAKEPNISESYGMEKLTLCQLVCSLVSINGKDLVEHRKGSDLSPDEELFKNKMKVLSKKSAYIIADLSLNYMWFDIRVRKLIAPEKLGNG